MDKFSGLFVKVNGEWSLHGKLDADVDGKINILKQMTDNGGKFGKDKKADAAIVLHSVKGVIKNRTFA